MGITFDHVKKHFEAERSARGPLVSAADLPISYEAITPSWLTNVIGRRHPGAEVVSCRLSEPDEGTSSRRRIFLTWNEAGMRAKLPGTLFCKGTQRLESRFMLALNGGIEAEVTFYNVVRPTLAIEAPEAYFASFHPQSFNSIIIMRDLGQEAQFCQHSTPVSVERAQSQMKLLATLHARYYRHGRGSGLRRGVSARLHGSAGGDPAEALPQGRGDLGRDVGVCRASPRAPSNARPFRCASQELVRRRQRRDGAQ